MSEFVSHMIKTNMARRLLNGFLLLLLGSVSSNAQCTRDATGCPRGIPHFVKFAGTLKAASSSALTAVRFVIYGDSTGGNPLWQEVQNISLDQQGRYEVMLGAAANEGIPMELFTSGEPRWLGVQALLPGEVEQARVLMVSVPYALEAADAQALGGLPASAYAKVSGTAGTVLDANSAVASPSPTITRGPSATAAERAVPLASPGSLNAVPKFAAAGALINSQISDNNGVVTLGNLSNILFADNFPNGVSDAVAACPSAGCIIYALSPGVNRNLGSIDPGTKAVTIYLGPYTYTVKQITLRKAMKIIGMGAAGGINGSPTCSAPLPCNGTTLQSVNGNNPVFVIPQTNNTPATNVMLSGFRLLGAAGNTSEDGFFLDTSAAVNTGLWYSTIEDLFIEGFAGTPIHVKGRNNDFSSATQWVLFNNVTVYRTLGGANGLRLEGATFELRFRNCQFDGQALGDGTNIYIGGLAGGVNGFPISIAFEGLVSQTAATAVQIDGAFNIVFQASHHEVLWGGYQITNNTSIGTHGVTISDSYFAGNVAVNGGAGYALKITTTLASGIFFTHNALFGNPDSIVSGMNLASVSYQDNLYGGLLPNPPTSGLTAQINAAPSINIKGVHSVGLNSSPIAISTIQSGLGPGEMVTFFTLGGPVTFAAGGNIDLMGASSVTFNGSFTFVRTDLGGRLWKPVAQWSPYAGARTPPTLSREPARNGVKVVP